MTHKLPSDTEEPIIHSHADDVLPDTHPLADEQLHCQCCGTTIHAANNECMTAWVEFGEYRVCLHCFLQWLNTIAFTVLGSEGNFYVLYPVDFNSWMRAKGKTNG